MRGNGDRLRRHCRSQARQQEILGAAGLEAELQIRCVLVVHAVSVAVAVVVLVVVVAVVAVVVVMDRV